MLLEEIDIYIAEKPGPLAALELVDAYGRAFICLPRAEAVQRGLPDALVGENRSVAIYSVGRNGKDENGRGDDIFWEEF